MLVCEVLNLLVGEGLVEICLCCGVVVVEVML